MWVLQWEFQVTTSILKEPCKYRILRFGLMMNDFKIMNYFSVGICPTSQLQSWKVPKSHSIHVQNPTKSPFSNKELVWMFEICHGGQNKVNIQFAYVLFACILKFLEGE
jgi:hypothetical protein